MIPEYEIKIKNNHPYLDRSYAILSKPPTVTSTGASPAIWSNVIANLLIAPGGSGVFEMSAQWSAVNAYGSGSPDTGVFVLPNNTEPISLGYIDSHTGQQVLGSTVEMSVKESGIPRFLQPSPPDSGPTGSFVFVTDDSFTVQKAQDTHYLIGVGCVRAGSDGNAVAPVALFTPQPGVTYQITPTTTYWIAANYPNANELVDSAKMGQPLEIVFSPSEGSTVNVEAEPNGTLVLV